MAPGPVRHVEPGLVDHLVEIVELLPAEHADRHEREGRGHKVAVRDLFHPVDQIDGHPRVFRRLPW